ncbi:type VI secretion system baseplate subunit TssK [Oxalobacteraceae bacterium]|nr:type VI secretion system baseplate subunit TssK [Oxalobacteraceae bacterium]
MSIPSKLLWSRGQMMRAQHFQQQDQYHEARLRQFADALQPYLWGVRHIRWNHAALANNRLQLEALSAIFRDGDIFDAPASEMLPQAVDLSTLPTDTQEIVFYAALPGWTGGGGNLTGTLDAPGKARFSEVASTTHDLLTDGVPESVRYLNKRVLLISDKEPLGAYDCFPVIRLRRLVTGGFEADPAFVPPSVSIGAAPALQVKLNQLLEALQAKVNSLKANMREPSRNVIEFRSGDVSAFWLLHTASTAAAGLTHYAHHPAFHPERLFEALLNLAGALMTYSRHIALSALPRYLHDDPAQCFSALDSIIRELLDTVISARYFAIALEEKRTCYHSGKLDSGKLDGKTALYLAISASMPAVELVDVIPQRVKVGAPDDVDKCVLTSMSGVKLSHAPQVPSAIPIRPETYYFSLDHKSALYEQMLKAQSVTVYIPSGFDDLRVELIAVIE